MRNLRSSGAVALIAAVAFVASYVSVASASEAAAGLPALNYSTPAASGEVAGPWRGWYQPIATNAATGSYQGIAQGGL
ncbi:MAG: hypothetical protein LBK59_01820, partial [Bifidobacteriaceae bacterium]|nr:hypothetical protein [Bifidobacteriaceae bacterium]